jgi:hypothetical protein
MQHPQGSPSLFLLGEGGQYCVELKAFELAIQALYPSRHTSNPFASSFFFLFFG